MLTHTTNHDTWTIELPQVDGQRLGEFLDQLFANADERPPAAMQALREQLDDANYLARWLREDLHLDLSADEAEFLRDSLLRARSNGPWTQIASRIRGRLDT